VVGEVAEIAREQIARKIPFDRILQCPLASDGKGIEDHATSKSVDSFSIVWLVPIDLWGPIAFLARQQGLARLDQALILSVWQLHCLREVAQTQGPILADKYAFQRDVAMAYAMVMETLDARKKLQCQFAQGNLVEEAPEALEDTAKLAFLAMLHSEIKEFLIL
jgi:hypothetical protein